MVQYRSAEGRRKDPGDGDSRQGPRCLDQGLAQNSLERSCSRTPDLVRRNARTTTPDQPLGLSSTAEWISSRSVEHNQGYPPSRWLQDQVAQLPQDPRHAYGRRWPAGPEGK